MYSLWPQISSLITEYLADVGVEWDYMSIHGRQRSDFHDRDHDENVLLSFKIVDPQKMRHGRIIHSILTAALGLSWLDVEVCDCASQLQ